MIDTLHILDWLRLGGSVGQLWGLPSQSKDDAHRNWRRGI